MKIKYLLKQLQMWVLARLVFSQQVVICATILSLKIKAS